MIDLPYKKTESQITSIKDSLTKNIKKKQKVQE